MRAVEVRPAPGEPQESRGRQTSVSPPTGRPTTAESLHAQRFPAVQPSPLARHAVAHRCGARRSERDPGRPRREPVRHASDLRRGRPEHPDGVDAGRRPDPAGALRGLVRSRMRHLPRATRRSGSGPTGGGQGSRDPHGPLHPPRPRLGGERRLRHPDQPHQRGLGGGDPRVPLGRRHGRRHLVPQFRRAPSRRRDDRADPRLVLPRRAVHRRAGPADHLPTA